MKKDSEEVGCSHYIMNFVDSSLGKVIAADSWLYYYDTSNFTIKQFGGNFYSSIMQEGNKLTIYKNKVVLDFKMAVTFLLECKID